ncbi:hypothetical protein [Amycolatopsis kentuckyensis]|uniref:hypothetical protein n=1 Tax=Amycolatopsis kentuckyensis TaxID=218823 RepID=UPI0035653DDD
MQGENSTPWPSVEELAKLQAGPVEPTTEQRQYAQMLGGFYVAYQQAGFSVGQAFALVVEQNRATFGGAR